MALSKERNTVQYGSDPVPALLSLPVAASTTVYQGALVVISAGYAAPASTATGLIAAGRAEETADNSAGAAGALSVTVRRGVFKFANGADAVAQANVGTNCYIVDDETVAATDGTGTRSVAGTVISVDSSGVFVEIN